MQMCLLYNKTKAKGLLPPAILSSLNTPQVQTVLSQSASLKEKQIHTHRALLVITGQADLLIYNWVNLRQHSHTLWARLKHNWRSKTTISIWKDVIQTETFRCWFQFRSMTVLNSFICFLLLNYLVMNESKTLFYLTNSPKPKDFTFIILGEKNKWTRVF